MERDGPMYFTHIIILFVATPDLVVGTRSLTQTLIPTGAWNWLASRHMDRPNSSAATDPSTALTRYPLHASNAMPTQTERKMAAHALHQEYLILTLIVKAER
jgi:hypothetical protein